MSVVPPIFKAGWRVSETPHYGFKVVPNGLLVDEQAMVRWAKFDVFLIDNSDDAAAVTRFLAGEDPGPNPDPDDAYTLGSRARHLVVTCPLPSARDKPRT